MSGSTGPRPDGSAEPAWLVVVDMQVIFARPGSPWRTPGFADAAAGISRLLPAFGDRVVYTRFVAPEKPTGAWVDYYRDWPFALVPPDSPDYDLVPELPAAGHPVVSETTFGKWGPALAEAVRGGTELVLTGVSTDAGVHARVVSDACAGPSEADHRRALDTMALYQPFLDVVTVSDVLGSDVLGSDVLGSDVLGSDVLGSGVPGSGVPGEPVSGR
jgi:nicotinamidase-related amidase